MSLRPPPKISLRHERTKELGSKVVRQPEGETVRQPEGEVVRQTKFFQSTQPTPNPIRDGSVRPDHHARWTEKRPVLRRSMLILFAVLRRSILILWAKNPVLQIEQERLVETEEIQARSSEDSKSLNVEQTLDRTGATCCYSWHSWCSTRQTLKYVLLMKAETLNIEDEVLRKRMGKSVADHDEKHESMVVNEAHMDFKIPGLPHSIVKHAQSTSVRELIQKIENHPDRHGLQQDLRQNQSFNPFQSGIKDKLFGMLETSNCVNCSRRNPRRSAKCVYYIGTFASSIARAGISCVKEEGRIRNSSSTRWTFFQFPCTSSRKDDLTDIDMVRSRWDREYYTANQLKK